MRRRRQPEKPGAAGADGNIASAQGAKPKQNASNRRRVSSDVTSQSSRRQNKSKEVNTDGSSSTRKRKNSVSKKRSTITTEITSTYCAPPRIVSNDDTDPSHFQTNWNGKVRNAKTGKGRPRKRRATAGDEFETEENTCSETWGSAFHVTEQLQPADREISLGVGGHGDPCPQFALQTSIHVSSATSSVNPAQDHQGNACISNPGCFTLGSGAQQGISPYQNYNYNSHDGLSRTNPENMANVSKVRDESPLDSDENDCNELSNSFGNFSLNSAHTNGNRARLEIVGQGLITQSGETSPDQTKVLQEEQSSSWPPDDELGRGGVLTDMMDLEDSGNIGAEYPKEFSFLGKSADNENNVSEWDSGLLRSYEDDSGDLSMSSRALPAS